METKTWTFEDGQRENWPAGPWDGEPDKMQWPDPATRLACMVRRGPLGVWCGYVGVDRTSPLFGRSYHDLSPEPDVHGGLTFAEACDGDEEHGICHVPEPGEPEPLWWFGFDCGHAFDLSPVVSGMFETVLGDVVYRDLAYARAECEGLAAQLVETGVVSV